MSNSNIPPMSFATKLAYGAGDLGAAMSANVLAFFLMVFLTNVAGMRAGLAGSVLMIGKIFDAVNDPIIGIMSDRTKSAWGRRFPWMIYGAIPFGFFFFLQWVIPSFSDDPNINEWGMFWYYVIIGILFNIAYTMVNLPYTAMTPELTSDYDERTSLNTFRFMFSIGGSIASLLLTLWVFKVVSAPDQRYLLIGAIIGIMSVLPTFWCIAGTWNRAKLVGQNEVVDEGVNIPIWEQFKIAFTNVPFLYVVGIYLFSWLALQGTSAILAYFVVNCIKRPESEAPLIAIAVQGTAMIMLPVWNIICSKVGKKGVYIMGMSSWIIAQAGLFFLTPNEPTILLYFLAMLAGVGVSTAYLIPWSMIPDIIELDELNTGQRREGIFYGFMVLLQKIGLALGLFLVGLVLDWSGFIPKAIEVDGPIPIQPDSALLAIRLAIGPFPMIFLILGVVLTYFYPITKEIHQEILLRLQEKKERDQNI